MKLNITNNTKVYILCPPHYATGGTELLHQLCHELIKLGIKAYMYYYPIKKNPTAGRFLIYNINTSKNIDDSEENIFIGPEIDNFILFKYKNIQKVIWWLSVDNHFKNKKIRKQNLKIRISDKLLNRNCFNFESTKTNPVAHFAQSIYAVKFLKNKGVDDIYFLSDYLNEVYLSTSIEFDNRKDTILYNPKKGKTFVEKLIKKAPDLNWIPIENMTATQVSELLKTSKVYIDFGHHPGKDRFPREAAMSGCCIITNREGSANNNFDVQIPNEYKIDTTQTTKAEIIKKIRHCLSNYPLEITRFEKYRKAISQEKRAFKNDLIKIFQKNKCVK